MRTLRYSALFALAFGLWSAGSGAAQTGPSYPATPTLPHVDVYHGEAVEDPYRWLERIDSPAVTEWAWAQDSLTRSALIELDSVHILHVGLSPAAL